MLPCASCGTVIKILECAHSGAADYHCTLEKEIVTFQSLRSPILNMQLFCGRYATGGDFGLDLLKRAGLGE
jgi:hypothetical protein